MAERDEAIERRAAGLPGLQNKPGVTAWLVTKPAGRGTALARHPPVVGNGPSRPDVRIDLSAAREPVELDFAGAETLVAGAGPGVVPLAAAAVFHLHAQPRLSTIPRWLL